MYKMKNLFYSALVQDWTKAVNFIVEMLMDAKYGILKYIIQA